MPSENTVPTRLFSHAYIRTTSVDSITTIITPQLKVESHLRVDAFSLLYWELCSYTFHWADFISLAVTTLSLLLCFPVGCI